MKFGTKSIEDERPNAPMTLLPPDQLARERLKSALLQLNDLHTFTTFRWEVTTPPLFRQQSLKDQGALSPRGGADPSRRLSNNQCVVHSCLEGMLHLPRWQGSRIRLCGIPLPRRCLQGVGKTAKRGEENPPTAASPNSRSSPLCAVSETEESFLEFLYRLADPILRTELHRCYYANVFYLGRFLCHCYALLCFACLLVLIHDSLMSPVCGYSNQAAGSCYYNDRQGDPNQSGRLRRTNKVTRSSDNTTRSSKVCKYLAPGAIRSGS